MCLIVSSSAVDCLERPASEMIHYVLSGTLNSTHSLSETDRQNVTSNKAH